MPLLPSHLEQGVGAAVVLLHGIGGNATVWRPQMGSLAAHGYRAIAWDSPGYGSTPGNAPGSWESLSEALGNLLDHLDVSQAALVGHSFGGMVAQHFVATRPAQVSALVLSGTSAAFGKPDGEWQRAFIDDRLGPLDRGHSMRDLAPGIVGSLVGPSPDPAGRACAIEAMANCPEATYRASMELLVTFDQRATLGDIAIPTLVLAGEHDTNAPAAVMERMARRIPGSTFEVILGAGHLANLESPSTFTSTVLRFLEMCSYTNKA